jgi:dipeptidyl aminopeptidase/acylaminoacyl peptidase
MFTRISRVLLFGFICVVALRAQVPTAADPPRYVLPPAEIVAAFDALPIPQAILSPSRQVVALVERKGNPSIAELARPMLRLAGERVDITTYGPHRTAANAGAFAITLKKITGGSDVKVIVPPQANLSDIHFSPDGAHLSFLQTNDNAIALWVADTTTGRARAVTEPGDRLNAASGDPCSWLHDSVTIVCKLVPAARRPAPVRTDVPQGPNVQEHSGRAAPEATYEDMIKDQHDEELFEYYFTSQLAAIDTATGSKTPLGQPVIVENVAASPNGDYLLVARIKRPFSHLVPMSGFPKSVEVWNRRGELIHRIADVPTREGVPINGVQTGPRDYKWRPDQPATIVWVEALDGGNPKTQVPFRDRVVMLAAPFSGAPTEVAKTEFRFGSVSYTDKGIVLLTESDRATHRTRTWLLEPGGQPRKLWDRKQDAAYDDPGTPVTRRDSGTTLPGPGGGRGRGSNAGTIVQNGDSIYLSGDGSSPDGDRPFLDRLNLKTLAADRLFRAEPKTYEQIVAPLDDEAKTILTRYETPADVPNYYVRDLNAGSKRQLTTFKDPQPQIRGVERQLVTYSRKDGVLLNGTLYVPPGYKKGDRLPLIMWAYPREFGDPDSAGQVTGSSYKFTILTGASHLYLLLSGYAVLDNPTMPIVGQGETANDTYVEQLVASAQAAIDKVVDLGVADRDRIGVGGHSYGAFMTANLLAHTRLFRAGFAESGAYNRSLTPFGFQNERRTFWEVPDLYAKMSPFWYANQIKDPILLTHGEADDNSGTFPIQSERFYMALKGFGTTVRYVTLPDEAHGYAARETLLHVLAERINWFDKYVKNASARTTTETGR